jgi:hypothetical protein
MFNRLNRVLQQRLDPDKLPGQPRQPTVETLLPGDVVSFWDSSDNVVQAVLECREELNGRETSWRWNVLDDNRMIEVSPEGTVLFERSEVVHQSSAAFETLTCDPDQGGVLKAFEARVRQGTAARQPTLFEYGGSVYRVVSTGIFDARPLGAASYPNLEVWRDINPNNPGENVYFALEPTEDSSDGVTGVLGIWTSHILLLFGHDLKPADITTIYPGTAHA